MDSKTVEEDDSDVKSGTDALSQVFRARVYGKRADKENAQIRRDAINVHASRVREKPNVVAEANIQLE